jgi:glycosyltransferase involved in cell wall biosynthesis
VLVHHGSLRPWHGTELLGPVLDRLPDATLVLIGDGPAVPHERVLHLPWVASALLGDLLAAADVGLLPYPEDAPPWFDALKLHDYRAVGLPVVGSAHPASAGVDRVVARDPSAWAEAIRGLEGVRHAPVVRTWADVAREGLQAARVSHRGASR